MIHTNRYAGLMSLYRRIQNAKYHHINPAEIFNSRLHDSFMHMEINGADITGIYSRKGSTITIPEREITDAITDAVNFGNVNCPGGWPGDLLDRFEAFAATLPPMRPERATELEAIGNHINFQKGLYYKFTDENGKTRVLASTCENKLSLLETDVLAGRVDDETKMIANFWSGLYWHAWRDIPASKQTEYLEAAGVQPGFFTFTAHDKTMELYFNPECKGYPLMDRAEAYGIKYDEETGEEISGYWVTGEKMTRFIDGPEVSTVKDKINGSDTINLMSSVTAKKGVERVEEQLTRVKDMREKFSSFIMSYNGDDLDSGVKVKDLDEAARQNKFDSVLGIVEFQGARWGLPEYSHSEPKLITPTNGMGFMFSRIDEMFGDIAGELAASPIHEGVDDARLVDYAQGYPVVTGSVMTGANSARLPTVEELEALIRDGKSLDGYNIDNTEHKEDTQPENFIGYISSKVSKSY